VIQPPLSLYVHLPWCVRKCPYCDFNSHKAGDNAPKQRYIEALLADLERESERAEGRKLTSIFLGGGTPSLFSPDEINELLDGIRASFMLADDIEVSMEANPGTVEYGAPKGYFDAGVTRLSIGAQSFNDEMLSVLGRIHNSADISRAYLDAREGGFENINIDLMHGLPGQSIEQAMADLESAINLNPTHISWYQLTLEANTVFYARPPENMPDDDLAYEIQDAGQALLAKHGYEQYEVSAYARNGLHCRHNMNYWLFGDYLAVGAGAHGKLTAANGTYRYQKSANPMQYMIGQEADATKITETVLAHDDLIFDFMLNALRLNAGFPEAVFVERTGVSGADLMNATASARKRGLIERDVDAIWRPTVLGQKFLNDLQAEFITESA
jgi:putative oxygen-independent coproporphyrinogen III oxidase